MKNYDFHDLYNWDETVTFSKYLKKTLSSAGSAKKKTKANKKCVKLLFCCNVSGSDKRKALVFGKSELQCWPTRRLLWKRLDEFCIVVARFAQWV